jgi:hypothetical protein
MSKSWNKLYKIRKNGMFSTGGSRPRWSEKGKVWRRLSDLSGHLGIARLIDYDGAEIVEYEMQEVSAEPIANLLEAKVERKRKREEAKKRRIRKWKQKERERQYEELKKEFGD